MRSSAALVCLAVASLAKAAGGHFDVDNAAMLEPGHCQYEAWFSRTPSAMATSVSHFGPGCRLGPVELAPSLDHVATPAGTRSTAAPQLKWVTETGSPVDVGLVGLAAFDLRRGGRPAYTLYAPLTWTVNDRLAINANLGADWDVTGERTRRLGVSAEWVAHEKLTLIAERVKFGGEWTARLGARFMLSNATSVDISAARVGPNAARVYVLGLNHDFQRSTR